MIKLLIVFSITALLVAACILYFMQSNTSSKKNLLKYVGFGTICFVVTAMILGVIVVLF